MSENPNLSHCSLMSSTPSLIGISCLSSSQKDVALHFGEEHSLSFNKFDNILFTNNDGALLIKNAKSQFVCEVLDCKPGDILDYEK